VVTWQARLNLPLGRAGDKELVLALGVFDADRGQPNVLVIGERRRLDRKDLGGASIQSARVPRQLNCRAHVALCELAEALVLALRNCYTQILGFAVQYTFDVKSHALIV
jgi:hypothetical protein